MENHPPSPQACSTNPPTESSFSFTPIKALSALPRLWDRKPSTPVRAGDKTRKLWKRIRFPFAGMNTATAAQAPGIGASKTSDYQRGVKRLCVDPADADRETEAERRGRSFLETKWEMQASRKRRKMPEFNFNIHEDGPSEVFGFTANQPDGTSKDVVGDEATNASPQRLRDLWKTTKTPVYSDAMTTDQDLTASDAKTAHDLQSRPSTQDAPTVIDNVEEDKTDVVSTESVQDLTQEQEIKLVRSALRSSLDREDAALLNEFLSKANAKRAAKATNPEDKKSSEMSSSPEESPEVECSTPTRRVLEELTTNSPSPVKLQFSPSKYDTKRGVDGAEDPEDIIPKEVKEEQAPSSPAYRRSTRTKGSSAPSMRNTISFRRAKGTEFVFQQRTEAQQVAMATRRNTRINKGKSVTPIVALEALAQLSTEEELQPGTLQNEGSNHKVTNSRGLAKPRKQVSWNEERMAEYEEYREPMDEEDEEGDRCTNDVGATPRPRPERKLLAKKAESGHRSSRSQTQKADKNTGSGATESGPTAPATAPATLTPRSRRVRRLGDSGILGSGTPVKTGSRSTNKPPAAMTSVAAAAPSTPTKSRRKLVPKSPVSSKLPARASTRSNKTTDQPFVSGIPTRSSQSTDDSQRPSMLQMSAGCTPTARRVRSRS